MNPYYTDLKDVINPLSALTSLVKANSASWEESASILPTVTNYLSTNNVNLSSATITAGLTITGNISGNNLRTSFNQGSATGDWSFAINRGRAFGDSSHAEGNGTTASGDYGSHAEGNGTTARGNFGSHAEGSSTSAFGTASHAEGNNTTASGEVSHAEGNFTIASGLFSHAEGSTTVASGLHSHAEGSLVTASGDASHAEGNGTTASGLYSHAEGNSTDATGNWGSHAEGTNTTASGDASHAEGSTTIASGAASHAEGSNTVASGESSHAEGFNTKALNNQSHAEGNSTVAAGLVSHAAGYKATAAQDYTYAWSDGNLGTNSSNVSSTRTGQYMVSASGGVFIPGKVGIGTDNNNNGLTVVGNISGNNLNTSFNLGSATGSYSFAVGNTTLASGSNSHAEGSGTIASNSSSHAEGTNTKATGQNSHAEGFSSLAQGDRSHAEGNQAVATGFASHAQNTSTRAEGQASFAAGFQSRAVGFASQAIGFNGVAAHDQTFVWSDSNGGIMNSVPTISSTKPNQFMVSATGGMYIPGKVGIGTDNNLNALTVVGTISTSNLTVTNSLTAATITSSGSGNVIVDRGNYRINNSSAIILGANSDQHLRFRSGGDTNSQIRMTILSSGEVGIGTTIDQTKQSSQLSQIANGAFTDTTGMSFNSVDWYGGTVPNWSGPTDGTYAVYFDSGSGSYFRNIGMPGVGPDASSIRQSLGILPLGSNVLVTFTNGAVPFGSATLSAAIFDSTYTTFASGSFDGVGTYTLSAANVPAGTNVSVGFWGAAGLTNVSLTAVNQTSYLTVRGGVSASYVNASILEVREGIVILKNLPTSSTGLPSGALWNNSGTLRIA